VKRPHEVRDRWKHTRRDTHVQEVVSNSVARTYYIQYLINKVGYQADLQLISRSIYPATSSHNSLKIGKPRDKE
jgi:hypothetical protein